MPPKKADKGPSKKTEQKNKEKVIEVRIEFSFCLIAKIRVNHSSKLRYKGRGITPPMVGIRRTSGILLHEYFFAGQNFWFEE